MLNQGDATNPLPKLFNYYARRVDQPEKRPTWTMDWKSSRCSNSEAVWIDKLRPANTSERELRWLWTSEPHYVLPSYFPASSEWSLPFPNATPIARVLAPLGEGNDGQMSRLLVSGRILNRISAVTDFTCTLESFCMPNLAASFLRMGSRHDLRVLRPSTSDTATYRLLEHASNARWRNGTVHSQGKRYYTYNRYPMLQDMVKIYEFDKSKHHRRLAILETPEQALLALVPATARPGDLIVGISTDVLPLVLRPVGGDVQEPSLMPSSVKEATAIPSRKLTQLFQPGELISTILPNLSNEAEKHLSTMPTRRIIYQSLLRKSASSNRARLLELYSRKTKLGGPYEFHGVAFADTDEHEYSFELLTYSDQYERWSPPDTEFVLI